MRESSSDLVGVDERIGQPCSRISKRFEASLLTDWSKKMRSLREQRCARGRAEQRTVKVIASRSTRCQWFRDRSPNRSIPLWSVTCDSFERDRDSRVRDWSWIDRCSRVLVHSVVMYQWWPVAAFTVVSFYDAMVFDSQRNDGCQSKRLASDIHSKLILTKSSSVKYGTGCNLRFDAWLDSRRRGSIVYRVWEGCKRATIVVEQLPSITKWRFYATDKIQIPKLEIESRFLRPGKDLRYNRVPPNVSASVRVRSMVERRFYECSGTLMSVVGRQLKTPLRPSAACAVAGPTDVSPPGRFRCYERVVATSGSCERRERTAHPLKITSVICKPADRAIIVVP